MKKSDHMKTNKKTGKNSHRKCFYMLSVMFLCAALTVCTKQTAKDVSLTEDQRDELLQDAFQYTVPLMVMDATKRVFINTDTASGQNAPINQLSHATQLTTAKFRAVVTPNVDTIYSQLFLDLREEPMVFTKPATDRYCSLQILDAWTNCTTILGSGGDTQDARQYLLAGPEYTGEVPEGLTPVRIPTNMAWIIGRTLIDNPEDMPHVARIQAGMDIRPLSAYEAGGIYEPPAGSKEELTQTPLELVMAMPVAEYFTRANELMNANPPAAEDAPMLQRLAEIGVGPGLSFDPAAIGEINESDWKALKQKATEDALRAAAGFTVSFGEWGGYIGAPIAEFGTEYAFRAGIAIEALGANPISVAIYSKAALDSAGEALNGANRYIIHFEPDTLPPVEADGFWSITMYGDDNYLIDNEIDRYVINDRSELVYNGDGSLDILVQSDPPEDENQMGNWLPCGPEGFHLLLRVYLPTDEVINGGWQAPAIQRK